MCVCFRVCSFRVFHNLFRVQLICELVFGGQERSSKCRNHRHDRDSEQHRKHGVDAAVGARRHDVAVADGAHRRDAPIQRVQVVLVRLNGPEDTSCDVNQERDEKGERQKSEPHALLQQRVRAGAKRGDPHEA